MDISSMLNGANVASNIIDGFKKQPSTMREENQIMNSLSSGASQFVTDRSAEQKNINQTFDKIDRQQISNRLSNNLDEAPDSVSMVQLANATYLKELNKYNVSF